MDVPISHFPLEVIKIISEIADSHFIAFDLEFSGVSGRTIRSGKPTLQEYYEEVKEAAEKYEILQIGLTIATEDLDSGRYTLKPYNFNITQVTPLLERYFRRTWSMNSGAIGFLLRNRFDFGKQILHGVHYLSRGEEEKVRKTMHDYDNIRRPDMTFKPEDDLLIKHIRTSIDNWLKQAEEARDNYLNIPAEKRAKGVPGALNRYQARLVHQVVQNEYPAMKTTGAGHFVQVTNPTEKERKAQATLARQSIDREVCRAVGFRWILEAMVGGDIRGIPDAYVIPALSKSIAEKPDDTEKLIKEFVNRLQSKLQRRRRVLAGHNCFTDLVNLYRFVAGSVPSQVTEFSERVRELFPAVIDTKHLASHGSARWGDTSLQKVADEMLQQVTPLVEIAPGFDRYKENVSQHEAGYDSFMTALIAIKLSAKLHQDGEYVSELVESSHQTVGVLAFGEGEGYVTATESLSDASSLLDGETESQTPVPVRTVNLNVSLEDARSSDSIDTNAQGSTTTPPELVAVITRSAKRPSAQNSVTATPIRSKYANATIYDLFESDAKSSRSDQETRSADVSFEDGRTNKASTHDVPVRGSATSKVVNMNYLSPDGDHLAPAQQSESDPVASTHWAMNDDVVDHEATSSPSQSFMPEWNDSFWTLFGNALQVNGCKEGVCSL